LEDLLVLSFLFFTLFQECCGVENWENGASGATLPVPSTAQEDSVLNERSGAKFNATDLHILDHFKGQSLNSV